MNRSELTLVTLSAARGMSYSPVQLQKALFLITRNIPNIITIGEGFHFVPYDYGPFDAAVYDEAAALARRGDAILAPSPFGRFTTYAATGEGIQKGDGLLTRLPHNTTQYISTVSDWVRARSFASLVKSIYDAYPEMRVNSVFQG